MPLKTLVDRQIDELREFLATPGRTLRAIQVDPDLQHVVKRLLVGLDGEETNPHVFAATQVPFASAGRFFDEVVGELAEANEEHRAELGEAGVELPCVPRADPELEPPARFERYVSAVADSLPDAVGAYVIVFDPERIDDEPGFAEAMLFLAESTRSDWAKYVVLDRRASPIVPDIAERSERASVQVFHVGPDQIEKQVQEDLDRGTLPPAERRQYLAMAGAFAFARKDYDKALRLQAESAQRAEQDQARAEHATALYNLGNTYLGKGEFAEAEEQYVKAAEICLADGIHPLLAMVMSNLGVALHRQGGRLADALSSLDVARSTFKALPHPPGEAYALDAKAAVLAAEKKNKEAEATWREALAVYEGITNPALAAVRDTGREDILDKLWRFFKATRQRAKRKELERQRGAAP